MNSTTILEKPFNSSHSPQNKPCRFNSPTFLAVAFMEFLELVAFN